VIAGTSPLYVEETDPARRNEHNIAVVKRVRLGAPLVDLGGKRTTGVEFDSNERTRGLNGPNSSA
jgi:hypothetical protein